MGFTVGRVIFQKLSQPLAPSIFAASYMVVETFCKPERKIRIWMPEFHRMRIRLLNSSVIGSNRKVGNPASRLRRLPSFIMGTVAAP